MLSPVDNECRLVPKIELVVQNWALVQLFYCDVRINTEWDACNVQVVE